MPVVTLPLADAYQSITRRVSMQMVRKIRELLKLPDNLIYLYKGESNQVYTYDSISHSLQRKAEDGTRFGNGPRLEIEIKEEESETGKNTINYTRQWNVPPIWECPAHEMTLVPTYIHSNLRMSFTYKTENMEEANRFRGEVARLISWQRLVQKMAIEYYIHPDPEIYAIMHHIYELQENNAGYGISEKDWLMKYASQNSLRKLRTIDGVGRVLAFKERQVEVIGKLDMTEIPEKSKRDMSPGYEIGFEFNVEYEKPFSTTLTYPIVVHNQMIDNIWIPELQMDNPYAKEEVEYTVLSKGLKTVLGLHHPYRNSYTDFYGITRPLGDNWICPYNPVYKHKAVYTALVKLQDELKEDDGYLPLLSLSEMQVHLILGNGTYRYIEENLDICIDPLTSPICFEVYRFNQRVSPRNLKLKKVDDDIILYSNFEFTQRDVVHVCFKRQIRWEEVEEEQFRRIAHYPDMVEELFGTLVKTPESRYAFNNLIADFKRDYTKYNPMTKSIKYAAERVVEKQIENVVKMAQRGEWNRILLDLLFLNGKEDSYRSSYTQYILEHFFNWLGTEEDAQSWWISLGEDYDKKYGLLKYYQYDLYQWLKSQQTEDNDEFSKWFYGVASMSQIKLFLCHNHNPKPEDEKYYMSTINLHYQMYAYVTAMRRE